VSAWVKSRDKRMKIRGLTEPRVGAAMGICIETNGSVLSVAQLQALEAEHGEEARRIVLAIGMKATNAGEFGRLTGMTAATAERFHKGQMRTSAGWRSRPSTWGGSPTSSTSSPTPRSTRACSARSSARPRARRG
jgi:hypothetical protein